jgi:hypothetical protein
MMARQSSNGSVTISSDPLGRYPIFVYNEADLFGISNNIFLLVDALGRAGRHVKKTLFLFAMYIAAGTGLDNATGYDDIHLLSPGAKVVIGPNGKVSVTTPAVSEWLYSNRPYGELLDVATDEILQNIRAVAAAPYKHHATDLTGGFDTRLLLAGILYLGLNEHFLFHTTNSYPNPDANTAALIRSRFSLRRGVNLMPPRLTVVSRFEEMRRTLGRLNGLMDMFYHVPLSDQEANIDLVRMGGGLGGTVRDHYMSGLQGAIWMLNNSSDLLNKQTIDSLKDQTRDIGHRYLKDGIRPQHVGNALQLTGYSRYHYGPYWRAEMPSRFLPLYSLAAIRAAMTLPDKERQAHRVGFDLMKRLCPELVTLPFAEKSWSSILLADAPPPITVSSPSFFPPNEPVTSIFNNAPKTPESELAHELAKKGVGRQIINFLKTLMDFRLNVPQPDFRSLEPVFDAYRVAKYLSQDPAALADEKNVNRGTRLITAYLWVNDLEQCIKSTNVEAVQS